MVYNGKPYEQMDDLGGFPTIFGSTPIYLILIMVLNLGANFTDPKRNRSMKKTLEHPTMRYSIVWVVPLSPQE